MIVEVFAGAAILAAGLAAWGWRSAAGSRDDALKRADERHDQFLADASLIRQLQTEVTTLRAQKLAMQSQRDRAVADIHMVRVERDGYIRRLEGAYEVLAKAGVAGGRDRVAELMRDASDDVAGDFPAVQADRGSGDDPGR